MRNMVLNRSPLAKPAASCVATDRTRTSSSSSHPRNATCETARSSPSTRYEDEKTSTNCGQPSKICTFVLLALLLTTAGCGCSDARVDGSQEREKAKLEELTPQWIEHPTSLDHLGSTEGMQEGDILRRGVTIETDNGDVELDNGIATHGPAGDAWRDAETGKIVWRAYTCINPDCSGKGLQTGPYLFAHVIRGARINREGYVKANVPGDAFIPECTACGHRDTVREFLLPEVAQRQAELDEELRMSRAARKSGGTPPAGVRTPMAIMHDRALLPRLYLVPR